MEGVNIKFKKIMLKVFELAESWQALHKENCECFMNLIGDLSSWETIAGEGDNSDEQVSNFGIFQYFPHTLGMIQGVYMKKLDEKYKKIIHSLYVSVMLMRILNLLELIL